MKEVLQVDKIFKNTVKGDLAKREEIESFFPNMSYEDVVKLILEKGEIQISDKERSLNYQNTKNDIANIIVEKTYNTENGLPFPITMITQVLEDIQFQLKDDQDAKKQALKAIKVIIDKNILPIERKLMQIFMSIKSVKIFESSKDFEDFKNEITEFLKSIQAQILEINTENPKSFKIKCNIFPNHYREILTKCENSNLLF